MSDPFGGETPTLIAFLKGLALLLFVSAGIPMLARRRLFRRSAIAVYVAALAIVLALIAAWAAGSLVGSR